MPAAPPPIGETAAAMLVALGRRLRSHRQALRVSATTAAEAAGISRMTLHRVERGEPSVSMAAYMSTVVALGLRVELVEPGGSPRAKKRRASLPRHVRIADYPQLQRLAWQLKDSTSLTPREALALYERNWRHVDVAALSDEERDLIRRLVDALGGERLLV